MSSIRCAFPALAALLVVSGCAVPTPQPVPTSLRLIDQFAEARLEGSPAPLAAAAVAAAVAVAVAVAGTLSLADAGATAWQLGQDVEGLRLDGGLLVGRSSSDMPLIHTERQGELGEDLLHEIEIRARVGAGTSLNICAVSAT